MRIILKRTGGILPITKEAESEINWSKEEIKHLIDHVKVKEEVGENRDATEYELNIEGETIPIDLEKVPPSYKTFFEELKNNLTIVKK